MSMLGGFAVLGGMDFSALELVAFCLTGIAALFLAAQKGAPAAEKRNYTLVFVLLMLSKLAAGGWRATCARHWCGRACLPSSTATAGPSSARCSWCASRKRCAFCSGC